MANLNPKDLVIAADGEILSGTVFSDNARPCFKCGSSVKAYTIHHDSSIVDTWCFACHERDLITFETTRTAIHNARELAEWDRRRIA